MVSRKQAIELLGNQCELCGSIEKLQIHHIDKDPSNNEIENLRLLCRSCHRQDIHGFGVLDPIELLTYIHAFPRQTPQLLSRKFSVSNIFVKKVLGGLVSIKLVIAKYRGIYRLTDLGERYLVKYQGENNIRSLGEESQ